jgi:hypothetical protein
MLDCLLQKCQHHPLDMKSVMAWTMSWVDVPVYDCVGIFSS